MGKSLISNPPYNMKWEIPPFAQIQSRFCEYDVPPKSNANFVFILSALEEIDEKAAFILPNGILTTDDAQEKRIRRCLVEKNLIESVILLPDKMFVSTSISTCILVINKNKKTRNVEMIDMRKEYDEEQREQNGQYGGASHEGRTYYKTFKVLTDKGMEKAINAIENHENIPEFCKCATFEEVKKNGYILNPSRYIEFQEKCNEHRSYSDIVSDYNRIVKEKNAIKITINESLAKSLGLYETFLMMKNQPDMSQSFELVGQKAEQEKYIALSKNKAEFKIENKDTEKLPEIFSLFLNMWKQHIMYLNNEENRILAEFRDALLPDLMNGGLKIDGK